MLCAASSVSPQAGKPHSLVHYALDAVLERESFESWPASG